MFDEAKSKFEKERESFLKALSKSSKEVKGLSNEGMDVNTACFGSEMTTLEFNDEEDSGIKYKGKLNLTLYGASMMKSTAT